MQTAIHWTNKSVMLLAGGEDPIEVVQRKCREVVLRALDGGWTGPPFSQVRLANLCDIPVEANGDVRDAATVDTPDGLVIQYNPTQARERVRFSIAHEIVHTFFPDCAERVRNRGGDGLEPDDWQLELLCNIGASEMTMPVGAFSLPGPVPSLESLLVTRREFDVSAEAFLIRVAKTAAESLMMFAASPRATENGTSYEIDYCVPSPGWSGPKVFNATFGSDGVLGECNSIGFSSRGEEVWPSIGAVHVEAVGIPAYPGGRLPRVVGIVRTEAPARRQSFEVIQGDILKSRDNLARVICQMVNDQAKVWGGGVARSSATKWPAAQAAFSDWCNRVPRKERLGQIHVWRDRDIVLISLVAQHGFKPTLGPTIRYQALDSCLRKVADVAREEDLPVYMPKLGTGAAGARWELVEQLVQETLVDQNIEVTVVDLPPKRQVELAV